MVAAASLAGRPMLMPMLPMRILLVLIGISLGAVVTPATLNGMAAYPLSIAVLLAAMICISVSGATYLRVVHGWDKMTAYLAAAPGGLSQVMGLAAELDADIRAIAIVQTVRVVIIAVGLPAGLSLFGLVGTARAASAGRSIPRSSMSWRFWSPPRPPSRSSPIASGSRAACCLAPCSPRRRCTAAAPSMW